MYVGPVGISRRATAVIGAAAMAASGVVSACVHGQRGGSEPSGTAGAAASDVITEADISRIHADNALDAVQKLHANFLSYRGRTSLLDSSPSEPTVYLDGVPFGVWTSLRSIPASDVSSIRLYRAWEAGQKFGAGNMGGVIDVRTKR